MLVMKMYSYLVSSSSKTIYMQVFGSSLRQNLNIQQTVLINIRISPYGRVPKWLLIVEENYVIIIYYAPS